VFGPSEETDLQRAAIVPKSLHSMARIIQPIVLIAAVVADTARALTYTIPSTALTGGYSYAPLDPAPVGIS
jgi:hypothetical protein